MSFVFSSHDSSGNSSASPPRSNRPVSLGLTPRTGSTPRHGAVAAASPRTPAMASESGAGSSPMSASKDHPYTWQQSMYGPVLWRRSRVLALVGALTLLYGLLFLGWTQHMANSGGASQTGGANGGSTLLPGLPSLSFAFNQAQQCPPCEPVAPVAEKEAPACDSCCPTVEPTQCPTCPTCAACPAPPPAPACPAPPPPPKCPTCPALPSEASLAAAAASSALASVNSDDTPRRTPSMTSVQLLTPSKEGESSGVVYSISPRGPGAPKGDAYKLCSFTHVCASNDRLLFRTSSEAEQQKVLAEFAACGSLPPWKQSAWCGCFHSSFRPAFLSAEEASWRVSERPHHWSVMKWVPTHHIAHWAQKLVLWSALYSASAPLPTPPIHGLLLHDSDAPMSEHERTVFDGALDAIADSARKAGVSEPVAAADKSGRDARIIWAQALRDAKKAQTAGVVDPANPPLTCFDRLSLTPHYGIFSTDADDTLAFRRSVYKALSLPPPARCPPRRVVWLTRHNRGVLNRGEIAAQLEREFNLKIEFASVSGSTPSAEQVALFARTGLMLSSHSSQLINLLFSPPGAAVIEVAPEFYNADFAEYAHGVGVWFRYALGGSVPKGEAQPLQRDCLEHLEPCEGASHCVLTKRHACKNEKYPNKNKDFLADPAQVARAVKNALVHLNYLCNGRW